MVQEIPATLGKRVAQMRDRRGWKQKELAEASGLSVTFISEIENDRRAPGTEALLRVAEALGTSLDYLVKGVTEAEPVPTPLVVPAELTAAAERKSWSFGVVSDLIKARRMVVARRGGDATDQRDKAWSVEEWIAFHDRFFFEG